MDILQAVQAALSVLRGGLDLGWPLLLLLPLISPRLFGQVPPEERRFWRRLYCRMLRLERSWGRWWPVPAAVLPGGIGLVSILGEKGDWTLDQRASTVTVLLLAVAVLQLYGQKRNNRDRIKTENRFTDLVNEVNQGRREALDARREASARGAALNTIISSIQSKQAELEDGIRRIADGISALASQVEEEEGSEDA